jgi:hypothetical protein
MKKVTRQISIAALALLCAATAFAGRNKAERPDSVLQRVTSLDLKGDVATFKLADGNTLQLAASVIRVSRGAGEEVAADRAPRSENAMKGKTRISLNDLASMSQAGALPAVVRVKYDKDGYVKRAKVIVFANEADASSFVERAARQRAEIKAASKPNH